MRRSAPAVVTTRAVGQPAVITEDPGGGGGGRRQSHGKARSTWAGRLVAVPLAVVALMLVFGAAQASAAWTGWGEVPGGGLTPDAPATTNYEDTNYVFVRGTDNRIYQNRYNGANWTGWSEVPGGGLTPSAPYAVKYRGGLYLFVRGLDNRVWLEPLQRGRLERMGQRCPVTGRRSPARRPPYTATGSCSSSAAATTGSTAAGTTADWSQAGRRCPGDGLTPSAPHPIVYRDRVHLFVRGTDNAIYQNRFDGSSWTGWSQVPGGGLTTSAPGGHAWKGQHQPVRARHGRRHLLNRGANAVVERLVQVPGGGLTPSGPAATGYGPVINLVVRGTDNRHLLQPPAAVGSGPELVLPPACGSPARR